MHWHRVHAAAGKEDAALIRFLQPGDDAQQRRLAAARGAEQAGYLSLFHAEADLVQDGGSIERFADPADFQVRHRLLRTPSSDGQMIRPLRRLCHQRRQFANSSLQYSSQPCSHMTLNELRASGSGSPELVGSTRAMPMPIQRQELAGCADASGVPELRAIGQIVTGPACVRSGRRCGPS